MAEKGETVFTKSLKGMEKMKSEQNELFTVPFLDVCKQILPVLDKLGPAMKMVKADIEGNISRLETSYSTNTTKFNYLFSLVQTEVETKTAKASASNTQGLLWLTRAMDFMVAVFRSLHDHQTWTMPQICTDAYAKTLKPYHGWIAASSFMIVMKMVPEKKKFMEVICGTGDVRADMDKFCTTFQPSLQDIHKFLANINLDSMNAS